MQKVLHTTLPEILKQTGEGNRAIAVAKHLQGITEEYKIIYFQIDGMNGVYTLVEVEEPSLSPAETLKATS